MDSDTKARLVAIDIDDVTADTHRAIKAWAEATTGVALDTRHYHTDDPYWHYYDQIWKRHGLEKLDLDIFLSGMVANQDHIPVNQDAVRVIKDLDKRFGVVFITSRLPTMASSTREWLDVHIDASIPFYFAHNPWSGQTAQSKGELCAELGAKYLIDDSPDHCLDVEGVGVTPILFGDYGWNRRAPESLTRCLDWKAVESYFHGRE